MLAAAFPVAVATHGESFVKSGTIVTVVPFISGTTRISCDEPTGLDGPNPDSDWYEIPSEFRNHTFRFQSASTLDGDFMFFNANDKENVGALDLPSCWGGYNGTGDGGIGVWAYGVVPANATHVNIWGDLGFGDYKLEIPHPGCSAAPNCPPPSAPD